VNTQQILKQIPLLPKLPTISLPIPTVSVPPIPLPGNPRTTGPALPGLPSLPLPSAGPGSTCVTVLGLPVCNPLGRAALDPALANLMMPGVGR